MKKRIISVVACVAIITVATVNVRLSSQRNDLSDFSLANVEALTQTEGAVTIKCYCKFNVNTYFCSLYGNGKLCAQSSPGGNVNCGDYDSSCRNQ
jgi:hypothetical protein